jgi:hypothetical protein
LRLKISRLRAAGRAAAAVAIESGPAVGVAAMRYWRGRAQANAQADVVIRLLYQCLSPVAAGAPRTLLASCCLFVSVDCNSPFAESVFAAGSLFQQKAVGQVVIPNAGRLLRDETGLSILPARRKLNVLFACSIFFD